MISKSFIVPIWLFSFEFDLGNYQLVWPEKRSDDTKAEDIRLLEIRPCWYMLHNCKYKIRCIDRYGKTMIYVASCNVFLDIFGLNFRDFLGKARFGSFWWPLFMLFMALFCWSTVASVAPDPLVAEANMWSSAKIASWDPHTRSTRWEHGWQAQGWHETFWRREMCKKMQQEKWIVMELCWWISMWGSSGKVNEHVPFCDPLYTGREVIKHHWHCWHMLTTSIDRMFQFNQECDMPVIKIHLLKENRCSETCVIKICCLPGEHCFFSNDHWWQCDCGCQERGLCCSHRPGSLTHFVLVMSWCGHSPPEECFDWGCK